MIPPDCLSVTKSPGIGACWLVCVNGRCRLAPSGEEAERLYQSLRRRAVKICEPAALGDGEL